MKRLLLTLLPALLISTAIAPSVKAADDAMPMPSVEVTMKITLTPFNLAYLAHQGYFKDQGIPDSGELMRGFIDGSITAKQIVKAAVDSNRLPAAFLQNESYISAVKVQLYSLTLSPR
ncbi:hypothetical protein [Pseudanabaena sp. 'Roaring Creek']|uniref:hypothetical protein n=1 Tax=Pseudanabaena sp. 'Roaring Creek' TaxID=1681830 RepID=UPI0006D827C6|nr:hypothetical protein [Pseudanabaena sp. 'Roaring Creek']